MAAAKSALYCLALWRRHQRILNRGVPLNSLLVASSGSTKIAPNIEYWVWNSRFGIIVAMDFSWSVVGSVLATGLVQRGREVSKLSDHRLGVGRADRGSEVTRSKPPRFQLLVDVWL
jgi:hypothetical protein